ncbi:MAG: response regulator [Balneola sp.]|nr:MAG: response regulator [Balneola sp.]
MNFKELLPKLDPNLRIEYRLFDITLFLTVVVFAFWTIYSIAANYTPIIKTVYIVCFIIYTGIYVFYKIGVSFKVATAVYYSFALLMLIYAWLPAGGITGAIVQMFILVFVSGLMVLHLRAYLAFVAACLVIILIYSYQEMTVPNLAVAYTSEIARIRDLSITSFITLCVLAYALFVFKRAYSRDRKKLKGTILELAEEKEKAMSADKAKSDFLATISHEMRTPLNGIVGLSELLQETSLDDEQKDLVSSLSYSSELLHSLISDILDVTLIESGKLAFQASEIEVQKDIERLIKLVKPRVDKKEGKVDLIINHDKKIPKVLIGDVLRFRQILLNLINNAIKFTNEGQVTIKSELIDIAGENAEIKFSVIDTGVGISEEAQANLFSKFYKGSTDRNIEGTGLGLSISKKLVSLMGGEIGFESEEGAGSEFWFQLPFMIGEEKKLEVDKQQLEGLTMETLQILVAEDVRINRIVIRKMLEGFGIATIDEAEHGEEAVQMAKSKAYDIILMDMQMPVMDGFEASELIKKDTSDNKKPVILAITANALMNDQEKYTRAGIDGFVSKPITKEMLKEALGKYLN